MHRCVGLPSGCRLCACRQAGVSRGAQGPCVWDNILRARVPGALSPGPFMESEQPALPWWEDGSQEAAQCAEQGGACVLDSGGRDRIRSSSCVQVWSPLPPPSPPAWMLELFILSLPPPAPHRPEVLRPASGDARAPSHQNVL